MSTASTLAPTTATWTIDGAHSHVEFAVRHLMISTVRGRFREVTGVVRGDEHDLEHASIELSISAASIDTHEDQRDQHLRSADFFETERFPTITFRSTGIVRDRNGLLVTGALTIRGVTRDVEVTVTPGGRGRDPWGSERAGYNATTTINRREFGLTWNQALEAGGVLVSDEVKISVDLELVKTAEV